MNIMSSMTMSIAAAASCAIAILSALLWYVSGRAHADHARLLGLRLAHPHQPQLGAYEKARIERYLNEIDASRMTFEQAQQAIAADWIAYQPMPQGKVRIGQSR